jgi:hypothetical protein
LAKHIITYRTHNAHHKNYSHHHRETHGNKKQRAAQSPSGLVVVFIVIIVVVVVVAVVIPARLAGETPRRTLFYSARGLLRTPSPIKGGPSFFLSLLACSRSGRGGPCRPGPLYLQEKWKVWKLGGRSPPSCDPASSSSSGKSKSHTWAHSVHKGRRALPVLPDHEHGRTTTIGKRKRGGRTMR